MESCHENGLFFLIGKKSWRQIELSESHNGAQERRKYSLKISAVEKISRFKAGSDGKKLMQANKMKFSEVFSLSQSTVQCK